MIGVFGGTFNPVHFGHLRPALEVADALQLEQLRIIPCGLPPHREVPKVGADERLAMVKAAVSSEPVFVVDEREIKRDGPSYTVDTLQSLRQEIPEEPIVLIIGSDSFRSFDTWHEWQTILELAHLVVMQRPGNDNDVHEGMSEELLSFVNKCSTDALIALHAKPGGFIFRQTVTQLDISSSKIRDLIGSGKSARYLVPDNVWDQISNNGYYQ